MTRVSHAVASRRRKKRVLKLAKGQFGHRSTRYQQADRSIRRGQRFAYRDRRLVKREMRNLWVIRINAACREAGSTYSKFMKGLKAAKVEINRQLLSELAVNSPAAFKNLLELAQGKK